MKRLFAVAVLALTFATPALAVDIRPANVEDGGGQYPCLVAKHIGYGYYVLEPC